MARHGHPAKIAKLDAVQRAKQAAAEAALATARESEARAHAEAQTASEELTASQDFWFDYLGRPSFAPEFARAIADRLIASDLAEKEASERHRFAVELSERRVDDWRRAEAHVRATAEQLSAARRAVARRHEERRLAEFADRVTYGWLVR